MKKLKKQVEEEIQLNLTPMMDLFVALIPFLIMAASFTRLGGIDLQAPSATSGSPQQIEKPSNDLWLMFEVKADTLNVQGYDKNFSNERSKIKGQFTLNEIEKLKSFLANLQGPEWKMGPSLFHASAETKYEQAVAFLNAMRGSKSVTQIVMASGVVE